MKVESLELYLSEQSTDEDEREIFDNGKYTAIKG